jgi:hypothetical protein
MIINKSNIINNKSNIINNKSNNINKYYLLNYPYYKYSIEFNKKDILKLISDYKPIIYNKKPNNLLKYNLIKFNTDNTNNNKKEYFIIKENYLKTEKINSITDYFSEQIRIKCRFGNNISPLEYWKNNKKKIIINTLNKYKKVNIHNLRETMYYNTKLCSNFRITLAMTILNYFKPNSWLDISSGWGDRLLSAIFCKIKLYVGTDPNLDLHPCYEKIIDTFVTKNKQKNYIIHKNGFLEAQIKEKDFDIVFTSPPFFTLEKYSAFNENSITKFKNEKEWCDNFFIKSLIKAYNLLKKDGYMILYMGGSKYVMDSMHKLDNIMKYNGVIYFYEKDPRAIYVWKKIDDKIIYKI